MTYLIGWRSGRFCIDGPQAGKLPHVADWSCWQRQPSGAYVAAPYASSVLQVRLDLPGLDLQWSPLAASKRDEILRHLQDAKHALAGGSLPLEWPTPTDRKPLPHQWRAIHAARSMGWRVLVADDMGLGKTSEALWMVHDSGSRRLLVVCPVSVKLNWQAEIAVTLGPTWHTVVVDGTRKQRADQLVDLVSLDQALALADAKNANSGDLRAACVINYDLLRHLEPDQMKALHTFATNGFAIGDESHYLKSRDAERTELVAALFGKAKHVALLSGTPVRDTVEDLFSQLDIARPGMIRSYSAFADRFLVTKEVEFGKRRVRKVVGSKNVDELNALVNTVQIRRRKEEVLDLPPKVHTYPLLQLDDMTGRVYEAMKKWAKIELEKVLAQPVDESAPPLTIWSPRAKSAVEAAMRLEQIAQGFLGGIPEPLLAQITPLLKHAERIPGRPGEVIFPTAPKLRWLEETVESVLLQQGAPIIFTRFNAPAVWLQQRGFDGAPPVGFMHGGLTAEGKSDVVTKFQSGHLRVLLCQVKIAEGWNATRCQDVLFLGRDWSPAINHQAEDRAHRMGQRGTVNVQIPVVQGTIEEMVHKRLLAKDCDAQNALASLTILELMEAL
jgi:SWI/SNF-related matrix-associated actin-dependent regulator 1 of chromatin subfamily A